MNHSKIYLHTRYERFWHAQQALAVLLLLLSGFEVHAPSAVRVFGFEAAVRVHDVLGLLLVVNAVLGLFYAVTSGSIRAYLPEPRDFVSLAIRQGQYYARGIFEGAPHPIQKTREKRLNPLQKLTYLALLNVLLPLQVVTGILLWTAGRWPSEAAVLGGLAPVAAVHTVLAWLFGAFLLMHVYLITTAGPRWSSALVGMITGWEEVERTKEDRT